MKDDRVVVHRRDRVEVLRVPGRVVAIDQRHGAHAIGRPEVIVLLGWGLLEPGREDQQLSLVVRVVVNGPERVAADPDRLVRSGLEDVVVDLERDDPGDHEVDLLLARVAMPVTAAATGARQHAAPAEGDPFGRERARVPALLAVLGIVCHEVDRVLAARDGVGTVCAGGHRRPLARSPGRSSPNAPAGATPRVTPPGLFAAMIGAAWGLAAAGRSTAKGCRRSSVPRCWQTLGNEIVFERPPRAVQRALAVTVAPIARRRGRSVTGDILRAAIVPAARWPHLDDPGTVPSL